MFNGKPGMQIQVMKVNNSPDQPDIHHFYDTQLQPMPPQHLRLPAATAALLGTIRTSTVGRRQCIATPCPSSASAACGSGMLTGNHYSGNLDEI